MKSKILLHSCCAPCSSSVIECLTPDYDITIIYYNPNIEPEEEYLKRKEEQIKLLKKLFIPYIEATYDNEEFKNITKEYDKEKEGGHRCKICYELRLEKVAVVAKKNNFEYFGTTLTVSPYKNSEIINKIGLQLAKKNNIKYLTTDFKKNDGYKRSIELAKEYNLYRQNYCGCLYNSEENEK